MCFKLFSVAIFINFLFACNFNKKLRQSSETSESIYSSLKFCGCLNNINVVFNFSKSSLVQLFSLYL